MQRVTVWRDEQSNWIEAESQSEMPPELQQLFLYLGILVAGGSSEGPKISRRARQRPFGRARFAAIANDATMPLILLQALALSGPQHETPPSRSTAQRRPVGHG